MKIQEQIRRLVRIVGRLSQRDYEPSESLIQYLEERSDGSVESISMRTLQRDIKLIEDIFGIKIEHKKGYGYHISETLDFANEYDALLRGFELQSRIDKDSILQKFVVADHRLPNIGESFHSILSAIKECKIIEFDYVLYRQDGVEKHHIIEPYILKESQLRWYLIGRNKDQKLLTFSVERIRNIVVRGGKFKRQDIDVRNMFAHSFGIWVDEDIPIERVVLRFDALDGSFVKSLPLHPSQKIVIEDDEHLTIELRLRITNDFVMALLSRSRSIEVVEPLTLRKRLENIYSEALSRHRS